MNRIKKLLLSSGTGIILQVVTVISGLIIPRMILLAFGSDIYGLTSSISHFLGFISFLELGIGPVIQANLYKPLAENDSIQISKIIRSSNRFFRTLAFIFAIYVLILSGIFPLFIKTDFGFIYTASLIVIMAANIFAQYFYGVSYHLLLTADQKAYIQQLIAIISVIINTVLSIIVIKVGGSIHLAMFTAVCVFLLRPILQNIYVSKHYCINRHIELDGEPIKQKWNGLSQHIAAVVTEHIDVVLLTLFSTMKNISIYNTYYLMTSGVTHIILTAATGLEAYFGNMIAKDEKDNLSRSFSTIEWIIHNSVTLVFTVASITISSFVIIYTRGVNDANYMKPLFGTILVVAYASMCLRIPYFRVIKAAGHFKETQNGAFIATAINIITSSVLVFPFGLIGVAIGTLLAMSFHTCYFVWYLKNHILKLSVLNFIKYVIFDGLVFVISHFFVRWIIIGDKNYFDWSIYAIKVLFVVFVIVAFLNIIMFREKTINMVGFLKSKVKKHNN